MSTLELGRLKKVDLREAWISESGDFTPWLAADENLRLLGEAIGLELQCESQEKGVGPFRADIVCREAKSEQIVLIENQLERTDHNHLGQLLTYAAGLSAVTIVWIAERFTDEHRAALDWLNEKTDEGIAFFGLEIELWRIGDSPPAPKFNVVCKPNEWTRNLADATKDSELNDLRYRYWSGFVKQPELKAILLGELQPCRQGNLNLPTSWKSFKLTVCLMRTEKRLGVYVMTRGERGAENFRELQAHRQDIEAALGIPLVWQLGAEENRGWIEMRLPGMDATQESEWPRQHHFLAEKAVAFFRTFDPLVRGLDNAKGPEAE